MEYWSGGVLERRKRSGFFDRFNDGVEIRPVAGFEFGVEEFAIGANFERTAARRNEGERFNTLAEFKNFGRQTDGLRRVVSNDAIFDRYLGFHVKLSFPVRSYRRDESGSRQGVADTF